MRSPLSLLVSRKEKSSLRGDRCADHFTSRHILATGQDVANVAESQAGFLQMELLPNGSLYVSLTIPSLIVATAGGGTGLPTQRECLAVMGCTGEGKAKRLAQIIAAAALGGEMSLMSAVIADAWVSAHEAHGRNKL